MAWQLGANYGHLGQDVPIATCLRDRGHDVSFAVRDLRVAAERLLPANFSFVTAPASVSVIALGHPPGSYAEILLGEGFADELTIAGLMQGWFRLLELIRPDTIVIDYAPMALLAARGLGIPAVQLSTGFDVPPAVHPLPSIRPWEPTPSPRLLASENLVLDRINIVLATHNKPPLTQVSELLSGPPTLFTTIAELDHYGARDRAEYTGPIGGSSAALERRWPTEASTRIFAYLRPSVPGIEILLAELANLNSYVICAMPGAPTSLRQRFGSKTFELLDHPVSLAPLLPTADWVVSYGGVATTAAALLAGVPLLIVPQVVEQHLLGLCVVRIDAGILVGFERSQSKVAAAVSQLTSGNRYKEAAARIATKYATLDSTKAIERAADVIEGQS
jgi:UDP:flavonoid glycosyltransferase YjiC (YdhE family)